jgi:hypothetical protein
MEAVCSARSGPSRRRYRFAVARRKTIEIKIEEKRDQRRQWLLRSRSAPHPQNQAVPDHRSHGNSPDLNSELLNAVMGAYDAHTAMSTQALNSPTVLRGLKDILLNHAQLWESLRERARGEGSGDSAPT